MHRIAPFALYPCILLSMSLATLTLETPVRAEEKSEKKEEPEGFQFTVEKSIACTPVKNQSQTGTCWTFATMSYLESELQRMGKGEMDLSEMFVVRQTYPRKAQNYVRLHGNTTLGSGSLFRDALRVLEEKGVVPEEVYDGKHYGQSEHNHNEMDAVLRSMLDTIVANRGSQLSPVWPQAVESVLDTYLGAPPEEFTYQGQTFSPRTFADQLGLASSDYVELTSYTHHPFYQQCAVEIPDNWARNLSWNVPLNDLMQTIDRAIDLGYTVAWDGDVSEPGFKHKKGIAILPEKPWEERTQAERDSIGDAPEPELKVDQALRQTHFDNYSSTDDHLMHIVGIARDQHGNRYYITKNSWGTRDSEHDGFLHISEPYARSKTVSIIVHRDVLAKELAEKLQLPPRSPHESASTSRHSE